MKIISIATTENEVDKEINKWIEKPCEIDKKGESSTINLPLWVFEYINTLKITNKSKFLRNCIVQYLNYLKENFILKEYSDIPKIAPSRSEFIRHAFMWNFYNTLKEKKKQKLTILSNGMKINLNTLKTVKLE